jgi:hypothetical protein
MDKREREPERKVFLRAYRLSLIRFPISPFIPLDLSLIRIVLVDKRKQPPRPCAILLIFCSERLREEPFFVGDP